MRLRSSAIIPHITLDNWRNTLPLTRKSSEVYNPDDEENRETAFLEIFKVVRSEQRSDSSVQKLLGMAGLDGLPIHPGVLGMMSMLPGGFVALFALGGLRKGYLTFGSDVYQHLQDDATGLSEMSSQSKAARLAYITLLRRLSSISIKNDTEKTLILGAQGDTKGVDAHVNLPPGSRRRLVDINLVEDDLAYHTEFKSLPPFVFEVYTENEEVNFSNGKPVLVTELPGNSRVCFWEEAGASSYWTGIRRTISAATGEIDTEIPETSHVICHAIDLNDG